MKTTTGTTRRLIGWAVVLLGVGLHVAIQMGARTARHSLLGVNDSPTLADRWVHHTSQMLIALLVIGILSRGRARQFGLNLDNAWVSWRLVTRGFLPVVVVSLVAGHALVPLVSGTPPSRFTGLSLGETAASLLFSLTLVGLSEEVVFRGLIHSILWRNVEGSLRIADLRLSVASLWSAAIFTFAHVAVDLEARAFEADPQQLLLAFVLGLFYAYCYERTGSLLAPVLAHNAVNGAIAATELVVARVMA